MSGKKKAAAPAADSLQAFRWSPAATATIERMSSKRVLTVEESRLQSEKLKMLAEKALHGNGKPRPEE